MRRAHVQEMDRKPVDLGPELRQRVEPRLGGPPVVAIDPVAAQFLLVSERHALGPVGDRLRLRPARPLQPLAKVGQVGLGNLDAERGHRHQPLPAPGWLSSWTGPAASSATKSLSSRAKSSALASCTSLAISSASAPTTTRAGGSAARRHFSIATATSSGSAVAGSAAVCAVIP